MITTVIIDLWKKYVTRFFISNNCLHVLVENWFFFAGFSYNSFIVIVSNFPTNDLIVFVLVSDYQLFLVLYYFFLILPINVKCHLTCFFHILLWHQAIRKDSRRAELCLKWFHGKFIKLKAGNCCCRPLLVLLYSLLLLILRLRLTLVRFWACFHFLGFASHPHIWPQNRKCHPRPYRSNNWRTEK